MATYDITEVKLPKQIPCVCGARCGKCIACAKRAYRWAFKVYASAREDTLTKSDKDKMGNLLIHPTQLRSLLKKRANIGRAFRKWKRMVGVFNNSPTEQKRTSDAEIAILECAVKAVEFQCKREDREHEEEVKALKAALGDLAAAAELVSETNAIVQPFLTVYKTHGAIINTVMDEGKPPARIADVSKHVKTPAVPNEKPDHRKPCPHPDSQGRHEIYLKGATGEYDESVCRACGAEGDLATFWDPTRDVLVT